MLAVRRSLCVPIEVCAYVLGGIQGKLDEGEGLHPLKGERKEEEVCDCFFVYKGEGIR